MEDTKPDMQQVHALVSQTLRLARRLHAALDEPLEQLLGMNTKEMMILATLMDGASSPGEIAARQHLPAPTVTRLVSRLVELGLVERITESHDLRRCRLQLTELGRSTRERNRQTVSEVLYQRFGHLPADQVEVALQAIRALDAEMGRVAAPLATSDLAAEVSA
ncbi:MarR family winged helix-turn-helix transcriptional regulator [Deinococcus sonorensis]|uniref:MarR family winged helix-turn-helix transcriptional regulator n=2 Tax=Deinococcus sonorensis TaxID=309891 RepID=A0AAU7U9Q1_9DEIO